MSGYGLVDSLGDEPALALGLRQGLVDGVEVLS
ncbi:MAG: hypothetical protein OSP8Acid_17040 [uncultured Acidilobus sp. OSP8]|nr:MAG: hypothetical protein OSP8Acid_17040 [uncultured Acidilobus sp. OSP8]